MTIVADRYPFVVGVDTHARSNTYAIIATRTGARTDTATFPTSPTGSAAPSPGPCADAREAFRFWSSRGSAPMGRPSAERR